MNLTVVVVGAYVGAALAMLGGFIAAYILRQLPWQVYDRRAFAPVALTRHERGSRVAHHALPRRHELAAAVLLPLAALVFLLTIHARGVSA